ncbi:MAG: hypothetical protein KGJ90_07235 [Patescibacteria group bacterium]|nr:hypothetical protein [Patescibacteria group bacterium]
MTIHIRTPEQLCEFIEGDAIQKIEAAFTAKRKERYGVAWELVDWYGIPTWDIPEPQRAALAKWIRS